MWKILVTVYITQLGLGHSVGFGAPPKALEKSKAFLCIFPDMHPKFSPKNIKESGHPSGGKLVLGMTGGFTTLNFWEPLGVCPPAILELVHAPLFAPSEQEHGIAYAQVAAFAERDGDKITFWIRNDARFHNNQPVRPEDVIFSLEFIKRHMPQQAGYFENIEKVTKALPKKIPHKDALHGVTFYLKKDAAQEAAFNIATLIVLPKAVYQQGIPKYPVGCGPYKVEQCEYGQFITFTKIPRWWGASYNADMYRFDTLHMTYFKDDDAKFEAFKKGELDIFWENNAKRWMNRYQIEAVTQGSITKEEIPCRNSVPVTGLAFNTRKPILQDIRVRWALNLVFDFSHINQKIFQNCYRRTCSFFQNSSCMATGLASLEEKNMLKKYHAPEETWTQPGEYFTQLPGTWKQRSKAAIMFLREAGWVLNNGKLIHDQFGPLRLKVCLPKEIRDEWLRLFQARARLIGIDLDIVQPDQAAYQAIKHQFDYDMIWGLMSISGPFPGEELPLIYGSQSAQKAGSYNLMGITDPNVDALIQDIRSSKTRTDLEQKCRALDRYLLAGCYGILGWYPSNAWIAYWKERIQYPKSAPYLPHKRWIYGWKPVPKTPEPRIMDAKS
jgi:microcin C transport system substrate-binding protein